MALPALVETMEDLRERGPRAWIARWGFSCLVGAAALGSGYLAWKVAVPAQVPDFALKAEAIYRIEVGAAAFLGLYLVTMAFALALNNRGFSEIGVHGLKAQDITNTANQADTRSNDESFEALASAIGATEKLVQEVEARLENIETKQ